MSAQTKPLPKLNRSAIDAAAVAWVDEHLDGLDPAALVTRAARLIDKQAGPLVKARMRRDELTLSIREYGPDAIEAVPVRMRNVRLADAVGLSRARLQALRDAWLPECGPV